MRTLGAVVFVMVAVGARAAEPEDYTPTGSVASNGNVTTFSDDRVVSPVANVTRRKDGSWAGQLADRPIDIAVTKDGLRGVDVNLTVAAEKDQTVVAGLVFGRPFRLVLGAQKLDVRLGPTVQQYTRAKGGPWRALSLHTPYALELKGQAAGTSPPLPQLVLAFIANAVAVR